MQLCPACGTAGLRVIYAGLPLWLCVECPTVWGFFTWVLDVLPFSGVFFIPDCGGSYWKALMAWLLDEVED